jgi:hypothetical protein
MGLGGLYDDITTGELGALKITSLGFAVMQTAWRERNPQERIKGAKAAIEKNADCATAYILLAEEDAPTILESEKLLKQAMKAAETNLKKSQLTQPHGPNSDSLHRECREVARSWWLFRVVRIVEIELMRDFVLILGRDINVLIYVKRRLAMCARKLGRLKEAVKMFRDVSVLEYFIFHMKWCNWWYNSCNLGVWFQLTKEVQPIMSVLHVHENLIEALLEMQAYADVQAVLAKYDDGSVPRSATLCYTSALLKVRQVSEKYVDGVNINGKFYSSQVHRNE